MTTETTTVLDYEGHTITVGTKVRMWDDPDCRYGIGEVSEITDWDGDADDEGRSITIPPDVVVMWPDGAVPYRTGQWKIHESGAEVDSEGFYNGPAHVDAVGKVEELTVVA
jgi:hypothetical protein